MSGGTDQLREQLAALQSSLQAFEAPVVGEHPGLRLMAETLRERESHIRAQIAKNETCTIALVLRGVASGGAVPAGVVATLITAVDSALSAAAAAELTGWQHEPSVAAVTDAITVHLRALRIDDDLSLTLARPPGPLAAQLAHPATGAPLAEHLMAHVTAALGAAAADTTTDVPHELLPAVRALAELVVDAATVLEWTLEPGVLEARSVTIDQIAAQRLLQHGDG